jgi:competence protein ComEC
VTRKGRHRSVSVALQSPIKDYLGCFEEYCVENLNPVTLRLVLSSFLGRSYYLRPAEWERVRALGVQHLFVVSGFHIAVVFAALHALLRTWGLPGRCVTILAAWAYVSAVGFTIPATRAGIIATLYYIALTLGVSTRSLNTLGLSALVVILASKEAVFLTSFQFSYGCILSILLVSYPIIRYLGACRRGLEMSGSDQVMTVQSDQNAVQRTVRYTTELLTAFCPLNPFPALRLLALPAFYSVSLLTTSISIQFMLLPLVLHHSNRWSWLQPFSNLLLVPVFSFILPAAFGLLLLFWTPFASVPVYFLNLSSELVENLLNSLSEANRLIYVSQPSGPELLGFYWVLIVLYICLPRNKKSLVLVLPVFLLLLLTRTPEEISGSLQLTMLDVGQGESIHIRYPDGSDALVDTGGSKLALRQSLVSERVVGRYLWNQRARRLRFLLVTHPEIDHRGGYTFLASAFPIERLFFFEPHRDYDGPREQLALGDSFQYSGVWHEVLHPPHGLTSDDRNALSLVILLRYGHFSALLTGDIGTSEEKAILSQLPKLTVLKIAHHGSRFSTSPELLSTVSPQIAMISAGRRNSFGHPSPEVLERIGKNGALAVSTSSLGSLRVLTDGFRFELQHYSMRRKEFVTLLRGTADRNAGTQESRQRSSKDPPNGDN